MQSVIETAKSGTAVQGLFYNNNIECQHFREKLEQSYEKGSLETVISTLEKLVERQENNEIKSNLRIWPIQFEQALFQI